MRYATDPTPAARYDWETGLYSRWYIEVRTDDELARALRTGGRVAIVRVRAPAAYLNERLANWLRTGLRTRDLAGVVGPDTFVIVLTDVDHAAVEALLERARTATGWPLSAHVAWFPEDGLTFDTLLRHGGSRGKRERTASA